MHTHVALLRGINVGGHNRVAMADLRAAVASAGCADPETYLASGNALFSIADVSVAALAEDIRAAVHTRTGVDVPVLVRSAAQIQRTQVANPFTAGADPKMVHAVFLDAEAGDRAARIEAIVREVSAPQDEAVLVDDVLYLSTPGGISRSRLAARLTTGGAPAARGTARNAATLAALVARLGV